jgi:hypothetical protein
MGKITTKPSGPQEIHPLGPTVVCHVDMKDSDYSGVPERVRVASAIVLICKYYHICMIQLPNIESILTTLHVIRCIVDVKKLVIIDLVVNKSN